MTLSSPEDLNGGRCYNAHIQQTPLILIDYVIQFEENQWVIRLLRYLIDPTKTNKTLQASMKIVKGREHLGPLNQEYMTPGTLPTC